MGQNRSAPLSLTAEILQVRGRRGRKCVEFSRPSCAPARHYCARDGFFQLASFALRLNPVLVETHQKGRAFRRTGLMHQLFSPRSLIMLHPHFYPPVSHWTAETFDLCRLVTP